MANLDERYLLEANNLSDLDSASTGRTNLGVAIGTDVFTQRTITGTANQVTVTNGNGVSGNPTLATPQDIHTGASPTFVSVTLTGTIEIPTTTATVGQIIQNGNRIIHNYADASANGYNLFIGELAGNFTSDPDGGASFLASNNMAIGYGTLQDITTAYSNTAIGRDALTALTTGNSNVVIGTSAGIKMIGGGSNVAIGRNALGAATGTNSIIAIGRDAMAANLTGFSSIAIGEDAGELSTGSYNVFIGHKAGATAEVGEKHICIGWEADVTAWNSWRQLNIGDVLFGTLATNPNITINARTVSANYDLMLAGDGVLGLKESATPTADTDYGKVYCKNDNKLYFQDGAGAEHEIAFV